MLGTLKNYYTLAKPGIIYGNGLIAAAGFFTALHEFGFDWSPMAGSVINGMQGIHILKVFIALLIGLGLIVASSCVFNNILDRDIDAKMERTKNRPTVTGQISIRHARIFGIVLMVLGIFILITGAGWLTPSASLFGAFVYLVFYTPLKRKTPYAALVGSIAGAMPPVAGYFAILTIAHPHLYPFDGVEPNYLSAHFYIGALLIFLVFSLWQMPHFYAIALYRMDEYARANIPVLPLKKGIRTAKIDILIYVFIFTIFSILLYGAGFASVIYLWAIIIIGIIWLGIGFKGLSTEVGPQYWARNMFLFSLVAITVISLTLII